jgi:hypothetical protein
VGTYVSQYVGVVGYVVVGVRYMYVASPAHAMRARIFLTEYALIFYRLYVKVLLHVHERTKTTRTFISTLAGVLLRK